MALHHKIIRDIYQAPKQYLTNSFARLLMAGLPALVVAFLVASPPVFAATSPSLGTAGSFSLLAESAITNVPSSVISRDVGLSPASGSFIGLTDAEVGGTIYAVDGAAPPAANASNNPGLLTTAINDMMQVWSTGVGTGVDQPCTVDYSGTGVKDLTTVSPLIEGVYCADAFILSGNLTLSGTGVWIFKAASTLTTASGSTVTGGDPCHVWWRLGSGAAAIGTNSSIIGTILAGTSITMQTGASINGRLLSQAAITLDHNTVSGPACGSVGSAGSAGSSSGTGSGTGAGGSSTGSATPGLPNTGFGPASQNSSLYAVGITGIAVLALALVVRKRLPGNR